MLHLQEEWMRLLHFFFNDTATTEIYTLSLHDALPILERLPTSFTLVIIAFTANLMFSIPLGAWLGSRPDRQTRKVAATAVFVAQGIPGYITGLVLIQIFAVELRWLPSIGNQGPESWIMPALTLASFQAPHVIRVISANVSEAMREDFIRTACAHGAEIGRASGRESG